MKRRLKTYGFSEHAMEIVTPIIEAIEQNYIVEAEQILGKLCLDVCDRIEKATLSPKDADDYFTLIDLYITDNCKDLELKEEMQNIIFEGMLLHDYGKDYGANLDTIRLLAKKLYSFHRHA